MRRTIIYGGKNSQSLFLRSINGGQFLCVCEAVVSCEVQCLFKQQRKFFTLHLLTQWEEKLLLRHVSIESKLKEITHIKVRA